MSTEYLSQNDAAFDLRPVVDTTIAPPDANVFAHTYLIPINDPARFAFDEIVSRIKLDPAPVPPQCVDNICISPTRAVICPESDDDTDAETPVRREIWEGYYHIRIAKESQ